MGEKIVDLPYHASGRLTHLAIPEFFLYIVKNM